MVSFTAKASRMACFSYSFFPFFQMALEYLAFIFYITFLIHHKLIFLSFSIFCSCSSCAIFIISFTRCGSFSLVLKPSFLALPRKSISLYQIISLSITTKCAEWLEYKIAAPIPSIVRTSISFCLCSSFKTTYSWTFWCAFSCRTGLWRVREISVSLKITAFFIMIFVFWVHWKQLFEWIWF